MTIRHARVEHAADARFCSTCGAGLTIGPREHHPQTQHFAGSPIVRSWCECGWIRDVGEWNDASTATAEHWEQNLPGMRCPNEAA